MKAIGALLALAATCGHAGAQCVDLHDGDRLTLVAKVTFTPPNHVRLAADNALCATNFRIESGDEEKVAAAARSASRVVVTGWVSGDEKLFRFHADKVFAAPTLPDLVARMHEFDLAANESYRCIGRADAAIARERAIGQQVGLIDQQRLYAAGEQKVTCTDRFMRLTLGACRPWECTLK